MPNKDGTSFLPLGLREKTSIDNDDGIKRMVHSLESCNYLKIENSNHLKFMNAKNGETDRIVMIQEQFIDYDGNTNFDDIYQICISEMNLRELMQFQSIFKCKTQKEIVSLIEMHDDVSLFFKSFLELNIQNLVSILAFDSRCIQALLSKSKQSEYDMSNPVFYKIKEHNYDG